MEQYIHKLDKISQNKFHGEPNDWLILRHDHSVETHRIVLRDVFGKSGTGLVNQNILAHRWYSPEMPA
jgi:hypothetical protein